MAAVSNRFAQTPLKARSLYSAAERQSLLEIFDLEVEDRARAFQAALSATLSSFKIRSETELIRIPRDLRSLTLRELRERWGGSWKGTLLRVAKEKVEERAKEFELVEERKRKRAEEEEAPKKNARKETKIKRKLKNKPPTTPGPASTSQLPTSSFNPQLPPTPQFPGSNSKPRAMKRNESLHSVNGSPLVVADDDDDELPDPEEMERAILAAGSPPSKPSSRGKLKKRAPSFMFRSVAATPAPATSQSDTDRTEIELSDGRLLSFDPLNLSPGRIDAELEEGGLADAEKRLVKIRVKEEVVKSLTEKMDRWKVL